MSSYTFATANLGPTPTRRRAAAHQLVTHPAIDLAGVNEADAVARRELRSHSETHGSWLPGLDGFVWRRELVTFRPIGSRVLSLGGWRKVKVNRRRRRRRFGPTRHARAGLVTVASRSAVHVQTHLMAQAWTKQRWRRPFWWASVARLRAYLWALQRRPSLRGLPVFVSGDVNTDKPKLWLGRGFVELDSPDTFGRGRYDRIWLRSNGRARVGNVRRWRTRSDHYALLVDVELTR